MEEVSDLIVNVFGGSKNLELITSRESDVGVANVANLLVWLIVIRKERNSIKMCRFIKENGTPPFGMLWHHRYISATIASLVAASAENE